MRHQAHGYAVWMCRSCPSSAMSTRQSWKSSRCSFLGATRTAMAPDKLAAGAYSSSALICGHSLKGHLIARGMAHIYLLTSKVKSCESYDAAWHWSQQYFGTLK